MFEVGGWRLVKVSMVSMKKRFESGIRPRRVVIKIGTSSLTHESGRLNFTKIDLLVRQLVDLKNRGTQVVVVSSGAIGAGMGQLSIEKATATMAQKQALAAVGQNILMHIYHKLAAEYGCHVGQILLTREDIEDPIRGAYSKDALLALLELDVMPIVNENDAVAVDEIKFGDNDRLSAMVATLVEAEWLVMLSDIDGFYDANPKEYTEAKLIEHITELTDEHRAGATLPTTLVGTGGMQTKLMAVAIADACGIHSIIANSETPHVISRIFSGDAIGTWFESAKGVKAW